MPRWLGRKQGCPDTIRHIATAQPAQHPPHRYIAHPPPAQPNPPARPPSAKSSGLCRSSLAKAHRKLEMVCGLNSGIFWMAARAKSCKKEGQGAAKVEVGMEAGWLSVGGGKWRQWAGWREPEVESRGMSSKQAGLPQRFTLRPTHMQEVASRVDADVGVRPHLQAAQWGGSQPVSRSVQPASPNPNPHSSPSATLTHRGGQVP